MSRLVALVALVALTTSCTTGGRVFGGAAVVSTIAAVSAAPLFDDHKQGHPEVEAGGLAVLALACAIAGIYFEIARPDIELAAPEPTPPTPIADAAPLVATTPARDPQAAQLTQQAYFAARIGQCTAVKVLGDKVRVADPNYFNSVFSVDPTIAKCL